MLPCISFPILREFDFDDDHYIGYDDDNDDDDNDAEDADVQGGIIGESNSWARRNQLESTHPGFLDLQCMVMMIIVITIVIKITIP